MFSLFSLADTQFPEIHQSDHAADRRQAAMQQERDTVSTTNSF